MQILELLPIKAHIFDISRGWEKAKNEMMDIILEDFWRGRPFQFNAKSKGVIEMAAEKNQDIKRAYDLLQIISKDEKARMLYEAREAELRDQLTRLKVAEDKGRAEGRMEGRAEGMNMGETQKALKIAEKMLRRGDSAEDVAELTELSPEKVAELKAELFPQAL